MAQHGSEKPPKDSREARAEKLRNAGFVGAVALTAAAVEVPFASGLFAAGAVFSGLLGFGWEGARQVFKNHRTR